LSINNLIQVFVCTRGGTTCLRLNGYPSSIEVRGKIAASWRLCAKMIDRIYASCLGNESIALSENFFGEH
jgi:hypothetical protein